MGVPLPSLSKDTRKFIGFPAFDLFIVVFPSTLLGLVTGPVQAILEEFADMLGVKRNAEVPVNKGGHPSSRPEFIGITVVGCSLTQQLFQLLQLAVGQLPFGPENRFGPKASRGTSHPPPPMQRRRGNTQHPCDHRRRFACGDHLDGTSASSFQFSCCSLRSHTIILYISVCSVFRNAGRSSRASPGSGRGLSIL